MLPFGHEIAERELSDILKLQSDDAGDRGRSPRAVDSRRAKSTCVYKTIEPKAHEAYLLGRYTWQN